MNRMIEKNPVVAVLFVAVFSALGFLALKALLGGVESTDYVTAPLVGIGGAIGYHFGRRRSEQRRRDATPR